MKNFNFQLITALVLSVALMTGCGLKKMAKKYDTVKYQTTPEVLETHGGKINATVKGTFPAKYFDKKTTVDFTPVLKWDGGSQSCKTIKIEGEKVKSGNGTVVAKKTGGSFEFSDVLNYKPEMNASQLVVNAKATRGKKTIDLGEVVLAEGVIYTSERVAKDQEIATADHGYQKETLITEKANLYFDYNSYNYSASQKLNKEDANKQAIETIKEFIQKGWKIKSIDVNAWASPEGEEAYNSELSTKRAEVAEKYIKDYITDLDKKIAKDSKKKYDEVKREYTTNPSAKGEDLSGFMTVINKSNMPEKQAIINVIESQSSKADREREIKNMTVIYAEIEDILEPLRRAEISVVCYEPKRTDENIAKLAVTSPDSLTAAELLYAATLTEDEATKLKIYQAGTKTFADNWKFWNNAGTILLKQGKTDEATSYVEKANALSPNTPEVLANMGIIASNNGDYEKAKTYFESSAAAGINQEYNLGILKIREGDYDGAISNFGSKTCTSNIALANLLKGNYDAATKNLDCVNPQDASVFYLKAVVGARSANKSMMYDNLKKAIEGDASFKAQAKGDREFIKYFNETEFQNIVR